MHAVNHKPYQNAVHVKVLIIIGLRIYVILCDVFNKPHEEMTVPGVYMAFAQLDAAPLLQR